VPEKLRNKVRITLGIGNGR